MADEPTAFIATYGQGSPVIGILGEFDALPGLSQAAVPDRNPVAAAAPGHGCGHNLLGSGAALAAVALKEYMEKNRVAGTLRYYGTPAEEGGDGKVYMVRAGLFRDVDVVLHWHPADRNSVINGGALAITSAKFLFHGVAAHAAFAPERGRSALDAVMLMGTGVEFMREHVPSNTRIHYIVSNGGAAPNIVPDTAELFLYARSPSLDTLDGIWERIVKIGQGAAMMTETTLEVKILGSDNNIVANDAAGQSGAEESGGGRRLPLFTPKRCISRKNCRRACRRAARGDPGIHRFHPAAAPVRSQRARRFHRCGRRQLERPHHRLHRRDICPWSRGAHLAIRRLRRHEHRPERHAGGRQGAGRHGRGLVFESATDSGRQEGFRAPDGRQDLQIRNPVGPEAAPRLPLLTGGRRPRLQRVYQTAFQFPRSAIIGSIRDARRAGMYPAIKATGSQQQDRARETPQDR